MIRLLLTSGRGPAECRIALCRTLAQLCMDANDAGLDVDVAEGPAPDEHGPGSVVAVVRGNGAAAFTNGWVGSIKWVFKSPIRPTHKRKNWFVGVFALPPVPETRGRLDENDVQFERFRAGGPGGQHQNKTESAVRAVHRPTGLTVVARDERSQHRNKALALKRLGALLSLSKDVAAIADQQNTQAAHDRLERGQPVKMFKA